MLIKARLSCKLMSHSFETTYCQKFLLKTNTRLICHHAAYMVIHGDQHIKGGLLLTASFNRKHQKQPQ